MVKKIASRVSDIILPYYLLSKNHRIHINVLLESLNGSGVTIKYCPSDRNGHLQLAYA